MTSLSQQNAAKIILSGLTSGCHKFGLKQESQAGTTSSLRSRQSSPLPVSTISFLLLLRPPHPYRTHSRTRPLRSQSRPLFYKARRARLPLYPILTAEVIHRLYLFLRLPQVYGAKIRRRPPSRPLTRAMTMLLLIHDLLPNILSAASPSSLYYQHFPNLRMNRVPSSKSRPKVKPGEGESAPAASSLTSSVTRV